MGWLHRVWHDPVGSKVIAAGIWSAMVAAAGAAFVYTPTVVEHLGRLGDWIGARSPLVNGGVLVVSVIAAYLGFAAGMAFVLYLNRRARGAAAVAAPVEPSGTLQAHQSPDEPAPVSARSRPALEPPPDPESSHPSPEPLATLLPVSLEEQYEKLNALEGRFYDAEQLRKGTIGRRVSFTGVVKSVQQYADGEMALFVTILREWGPLVCATFPSESAPRVFSLRAQDKVTVVGTVRSFMSGQATVAGESLELECNG